MRLAVEMPDPEHLVVEALRDALADAGETWTVDRKVPASFDPSDPTETTHIEVSLDGTPGAVWPVIGHCTIRLTAWCPAGYQSRAIRAANRAQGLLLAHTGGGGIASTLFLTGPLPARDPASKAEICSTTSRVTIRSQPIEPAPS